MPFDISLRINRIFQSNTAQAIDNTQLSTGSEAQKPYDGAVDIAEAEQARREVCREARRSLG
jgi:hypothetical protein